MSGIKLILLSSLFVCFYTYLRFYRSILLDRLIAVLFVLLGSLFIIAPSLTTSIAQFLGVGRGTDLVFYLFAMASVFAIILLYSKLAQISLVQTELVRSLAIRDAVRSSGAPYREGTPLSRAAAEEAVQLLSQS